MNSKFKPSNILFIIIPCHICKADFKSWRMTNKIRQAFSVFKKLPQLSEIDVNLNYLVVCIYFIILLYLND